MSATAIVSCTGQQASVFVHSGESFKVMGSKRFEGRHVLVSGGAAGVGGEASRLFAAEGAKVTIVDILGQVGRDLVAELNRSGAPALMIEADVSSEEAVTGAIRQAVERFGPVDVVHNHAGTTIV
jgi:NAD(P)-dependent dehydrogenase (short-subunit alcohol dehydrogenase family)